jgi:hypothetical protein
MILNDEVSHKVREVAVEASSNRDLTELGASRFLAVARFGVHSQTELLVILRERLTDNRGA